VIQVANTHFRYLRDCPGRVEVIAADGRLALEREPLQHFDLLVLDAFSGDSIPTHLFTREAFALYFSHLGPDGVLAAHITNKYLDLSAVVEGLAGACERQSLLVRSPAEPAQGAYGATWVLVTADPVVLRSVAGRAAPFPRRRPSRVWTDDYSNLFQTLR